MWQTDALMLRGRISLPRMFVIMFDLGLCLMCSSCVWFGFFSLAFLPRIQSQIVTGYRKVTTSIERVPRMQFFRNPVGALLRRLCHNGLVSGPDSSRTCFRHCLSAWWPVAKLQVCEIFSLYERDGKGGMPWRPPWVPDSAPSMSRVRLGKPEVATGTPDRKNRESPTFPSYHEPPVKVTLC